MYIEFDDKEISNRIKQIIKDLKSQKKIKSQADIARKIGISPQQFSEVLAGRNKMTPEFILNLCIETNISYEYITKGIAPIYDVDNKNELLKKIIFTNIQAEEDNHSIQSVDSGVPYYENIDVAGSIVGMYNDYEKFPPTFFINYPHFNDCTAYLPVVGDSMYPKFASGEIIAVKRIFNLDMIQWGEPYMIVGNGNTDNLRTIKLVFPHEETEKLILRASNPNFKGDTPIDKSDILEMYIVKGKITRNQY